MTTLEASAATETPMQVLRRLAVTVIWMWSTEPVCSTDERHQLLARLGAVSARVERLELRHEFEPDHQTDLAELVSCVDELDDLSRRWIDVGASG